MMIRRGIPLLLIGLILGAGIPAFSQEGDGEPRESPIESDWSGLTPTLYAQGDMLFGMSLGAFFPTLFFDDQGDLYESNISVAGGLGSLSFNYFLGPHVFLGGEVNFMRAGTKMGNLLYLIPLGFRAGYQFILSPFEFPVSLMVGMIPQSYLGKNYFGLVIKPMVSAFWRFSPGWSFGLNAAWLWVPQWPKDPAQIRYGNFFELTLSARYHF
jgi:hypothetical protein